MKKYEFMDVLEKNLMDISYEERREALRYYEDYFDEAGEENIEQVIRELGTPERVARKIKEDLQMEGLKKENDTVEHILASEKDLENEKAKSSNGFYQEEDFQKKEKSFKREERNGVGKEWSRFKEKIKNLGTEKIILLVLICILASPAILGILCGIAGIFIGVFFGLVGLMIGAFGGMAGMLISGIVSIITAIGRFVVSPANGLVTMGVGVVNIAIALLLLALAVSICKNLLPGFIKWSSEMIEKGVNYIKGWINNGSL